MLSLLLRPITFKVSLIFLVVWRSELYQEIEKSLSVDGLARLILDVVFPELDCPFC